MTNDEVATMMPRITFFTDGSAASNDIEEELRRRHLRYDRMTASEQPYSPLPGIAIGATYLAGTREIDEYLFRLLDTGYVYLPDGTPVLENTAAQLAQEPDERLFGVR